MALKLSFGTSQFNENFVYDVIIMKWGYDKRLVQLRCYYVTVILQ